MDFFEHIEAYKNGTLTDQERNAFEAAMQEDAALRQAVEDHDVAMDIVGSILESEVRMVLEEGNNAEKIEEQESSRGESEEEKGVPVRKMNWMRWAAAAAVVFVVGWWGANQLEFKRSYREIFVKNYQPIELSLVTKGDDFDDIIVLSSSAYQAKKYSKVINLLSSYEIDSLNDDRLYLMLASAYISEKEYSKGRGELRKIFYNNIYKNDVIWYIALSHLAEGSIDSTKYYLRELPMLSNYYEKGVKILNEIKE